MEKRISTASMSELGNNGNGTQEGWRDEKQESGDLAIYCGEVQVDVLKRDGSVWMDPDGLGYADDWEGHAHENYERTLKQLQKLTSDPEEYRRGIDHLRVPIKNPEETRSLWDGVYTVDGHYLDFHQTYCVRQYLTPEQSKRLSAVDCTLGFYYEAFDAGEAELLWAELLLAVKKGETK